jgi:hypothetical protein
MECRFVPQRLPERITKTRASASELAEVGVQSGDVSEGKFTMLYTRHLSARVRLISHLQSTDLLDGSETVAKLLRHQVLSGSLPPDRRPNLDPKLLHGLFLTFGYNPIQETWDSLVILQAFGALPQIDREACIRGILRFHHGKGLFGSVRDGDRLHIGGDVRDTLAAFESLRILGALDQVKDLQHWKFRPSLTSKSLDPSGPRTATWQEIEAWVCQQRFVRIIRERSANPTAPVRSLFDR